MDPKVRTYGARQADNKRRLENTPRDNHVQQSPFKRHNVARAYTAGPGEKSGYAGKLPMSPTAAADQRAPMANQRNTVTCYKCRKQGHYISACLKQKNQNRGNTIVNSAGSSEARGRVYTLGGGGANQDPNVFMGLYHEFESYDEKIVIVFLLGYEILNVRGDSSDGVEASPD
ncbi:reverse transcriptase domain-containing protein [Tanacetum coccineum]